MSAAVFDLYLSQDVSTWGRTIDEFRHLRKTMTTRECSIFLDQLASKITPTYKKKNVDNFQQLMTFIGLQEHTSMEHVVGQVGWHLPQVGWESFAQGQCRSNLQFMIDRDYAFSNCFAREMISISWRDMFLQALRDFVLEHPALIYRNVLDDATEKQLSIVNEYQYNGQLLPALTHAFWWHILSNMKKNAKKNPGLTAADCFVDALTNPR